MRFFFWGKIFKFLIWIILTLRFRINWNRFHSQNVVWYLISKLIPTMGIVFSNDIRMHYDAMKSVMCTLAIEIHTIIMPKNLILSHRYEFFIYLNFDHILKYLMMLTCFVLYCIESIISWFCIFRKIQMMILWMFVASKTWYVVRYSNYFSHLDSFIYRW